MVTRHHHERKQRVPLVCKIQERVADNLCLGIVLERLNRRLPVEQVVDKAEDEE